MADSATITFLKPNASVVANRATIRASKIKKTLANPAGHHRYTLSLVHTIMLLLPATLSFEATK